MAQEASGESIPETEKGSQSESDASEPILPETGLGQPTEEPEQPDSQEQAIVTLRTLTVLKAELEVELEKLTGQLQEEVSQIEERDLLAEIEKLDQDIKSVERNIEEIAAGADIINVYA